MSKLFNSKLLSIEEALIQRNELKKQGKSLVFTNGCFDILHPGHVAYLREAKAKGDKLLIGLNADVSVKLLDKGNARPIQDEVARAFVLAGLEMVDFIVLFKTETPQQLIAALLPDVLVKGGDYKIDEIVGAEEVLNNGGTVKTLSFIEGYSTTAIESKIKNV